MVEDDVDKHVAIACFRYITTEHEEIGTTPFEAMFGLDHELGLRYRIDKDPGIRDTLAHNLAELHRQLVGRGLKARDRAEKQYNKAIKEAAYDVGEGVIVYSP